MIKHYLTIAIRLLRKQRLFAIINILGLSIALGLATLTLLFVQDEFSFDTWHEKAEDIYRVEQVRLNPDGTIESKGPWMPYPFAEALERDHPLVASTVRMFDDNVVIRVNGTATEHSAVFADSTFFTMFTYDVLRGDLKTALVDPSGIVLTESAARRHFNSVDVVGRSLEVRFEDTYENAIVTAVVRDVPSNTNIPFEYVMPFHRLPVVYPWIGNRVDRWNASSFIVFAELVPGANYDAAQSTLAGLWRTYYGEQLANMIENGRWEGDGDPSRYEFIPLTKLHLDTSTSGALVANSNPLYSMILIAIAAIILALACINFVILTIGRGATRASEIGVRKAMGARRSQLMAQFGSESILLSVAALILGLALAVTLLPTFNALSGKNLSIVPSTQFPVLLVMIGVALITGVIAGWYPSLVISRHKPSEALRGRFKLGGSNMLTRTLVVSQFAASIVLVAGALVMQQQMTHIQQQDLGYNPDNVLVVHANGKNGRELTRHLEQTIGQRADVAGIAALSFSINRGYSREGWVSNGIERQAYSYNIEPEILEIMGVELIAGRAFDERFASDSTYGAVVNEAFVEQIGLTPETAVGTRIADYGASPPYIIGVIRNINFRSLHEKVESMIMLMDESRNMHYSLVRFTGSDLPATIAALEQAWQSFAPEIPLEYTFLDDDIAMTYVNDRRWSRIVRYAAGIAILIACMGLFGLAALTVAKRTKEIGVRKVLGATVGSILVLISRDFARLVLVATVVGAPVAYLGLNRWLEGFAYHVTPSIWVFGFAGIAVLIVALGTVAYHAIRAAVSNPVDSLRYE